LSIRPGSTILSGGRTPAWRRLPLHSAPPISVPAADMTLNSYAKDGILTVLFMDARILDEAKLEEIGKDLIDLINKSTEERVILDFRNVQFMSSSMLGKLVLVQKKCKEFKAQLKMCGIAPDIREVFKITKLDKLFDIEADEASARKAFMKRGWFG
jgi:anti-anti-sigma factor